MTSADLGARDVRDRPTGAPRRWRRAIGPSIAGEAFGESGRPSVVLLHGGGQTHHSWKNAGRSLAGAGFVSIALDLRGHGDSDWAPDGNYELDALAGDLGFVVSTEGLEKPVLVGASMGGATILVAVGKGLVDPSAVVLVDAAPRTEQKGVHRVRDFMAQAPDGYATLDDAAQAVAEYQPHRHRPSSVDGLRKNLRRGQDGRFRWHWDPKLLERDVDVAAEEQRLTTCARALRAPALLVRGGRSDVVSMEGVRHFQRVVPHAEFADVRGAGHMVAGDVNDAFNSVVVDFVRRHAPAASQRSGEPPDASTWSFGSDDR